MASRSRSTSRSGGRRSARPTRDRTHTRRTRRRVLLVLGGLALVLLVLLGWLGLEASRAQNAIGDATDQASQLQRELSAGETELAANQLDALQESTTTARTNTDGPLWAAAARIPFVGASIDAVRVAADSVDDIAQRGLPPLVETAGAVDADLFRPENGSFPLETFAQIGPPLIEASDVLTTNRERIDALEPDDLLGPVRGPVTDLQRKVEDAETAADAAATALQLAPELLGADGRRTYLLMFQNNAESRATGGIPGALALVTADNGRLSFDQQFSIRDLGFFDDDPVVELTEQERQAFDVTMAEDIRNATFTPDFPRAADIAHRMAERGFDVDIDGVLSIDPVALSYALEGTGDVTVADGTTLTPDNAVDALLNTVYARYPDPLQQDAFFAAAAEEIFSAVLGGEGDSRATLDGLARGVDERRIMFWPEDEEVEQAIAGTRLSGELPGESTTPHVGVYLNDATESKMQYYLDWETTVEATACDDGVQTLVATTTLVSTAPADAAQLPSYITGSGKRAETGNQQVGLRIFAPWGGEVQSLQIDGKDSLFGLARLGERPIVVTSAALEPGQETTFTTTMTSSPGQRRGAVVTTTPGVQPLDQDRRFDSGC